MFWRTIRRTPGSPKRRWPTPHTGAGSKRERVLADFLIGAHALHEANRLLKRDRGFCRKYFSGLEILGA